ncbi:hypothetical protein ACVD00_34600, partial [Pseudomonas aeruginosa]
IGYDAVEQWAVLQVRLSPSAESVRAVLKAFDEGDVIEHLPWLGALDGGAVDRIDAEGIADAIDSNLSLDPPLSLQEPGAKGGLGFLVVAAGCFPKLLCLFQLGPSEWKALPCLLDLSISAGPVGLPAE